MIRLGDNPARVLQDLLKSPDQETPRDVVVWLEQLERLCAQPRDSDPAELADLLGYGSHGAEEG